MLQRPDVEDIEKLWNKMADFYGDTGNPEAGFVMDTLGWVLGLNTKSDCYPDGFVDEEGKVNA